MRSRSAIVASIGAMAPGESAGRVRQRDRARIPDSHTWDTSHLYPSRDAWRDAKQRLLARVPNLDAFKGRLASSAQLLLECLTALSEISKEYARLSVYASLNSDIDTRDSTCLAMMQEMTQLGTDIAARTAYVHPEILAMGRECVREFLREEPGLAPFAHELDDILRHKDHTGTEGEERIIADAGLMADGPDNIYSLFSNADFPFPSVTLSDGMVVRIDKSAFSLYRAAPNRNDRRLVFTSYFGALNEYRRTFGSQLYAQIKRDMFYARARRYPSCLHAALDVNNIPVDVYRGLLANVQNHLPSFHRYLSLRQRLLALDQLNYHDLYAPVVRDVELDYSFDEARDIVLASLAPLGEEYCRAALRAFTERWIDVYPSEGKRSGAYSNGAAYDVHPYILLNYNGKYDDVSTLTHELGHTMHSYLTNATQPYPTSHYSIFVAEVASTFNEALLLEHMLGTISDPRVRLSLLGNYLDGIRGTVFRQTQFAEFELRIHEMAEGGQTLTGDVLNDEYLRLTRRYYGHEAGICVVDDDVAVEWAHIPHFFYTFYVFQYATSFTASAALSENVLAGDASTREAYVKLLSAGGEDYPIELLRRAGVDMTTSVPLELTMQKMNRVMDSMEAIIGDTVR